MHQLYLLFLLSLPLFAQESKLIQTIADPKTPEDFEHQFKGCLENSECDQVMGLQLSRWKELTSKLRDGNIPAEKKAQELEAFRKKSGIPVEFYTHQKSQQGLKPMLFNSSCKGHNPKEKEKKVLKGTAFVKSMGPTQAIVWRDQTQIEIPLGELLAPQPVTVYYPTGPVTYYLPLGDQPLFIKAREVYALKEDDGLFYILKMALNGEWGIVNVDFKLLGQLEEHRQEVVCPKDDKYVAPKNFGTTFCKTVWDVDSKKVLVVRLHQGCPI